MRVVIAAMGRLVPELDLLARELSRRFDTLVLLGARSPADLTMMSCCLRPQDHRYAHWSSTEPGPELERQLEGADIVLHLPTRVDEATADDTAARLRSVETIASTVRRLGARGPRRIVSLGPADEHASGVEGFDALSLSADVTLCTVRLGLILRAPGGAFRRTLCALRAQAAMKASRCAGLVQWIHELDGVRAVAHLLESQSLVGQFNLMAPSPVAIDTFAHALWRAYGLPGALRGPAASLARLLEAPSLCGPAAVPQRLLDSGFGYLFPELDSALADLAEPHD